MTSTDNVNNNEIIMTEGLSKRYEDFLALDKVSVSVEKGSIYGLVGPNGAGKTTLLKILAGVYRHNTGDVTIMGEHVDDNTKLKQRMVMISDNLYHSPSATVKHMMLLYKDMYNQFDTSLFDKIQTVLKIDINKKMSRLSKGMKKQVAFWLAISTKPDLMLLDEPLDGLDPLMRKQIWSMVIQEVIDRNMTVVISSHNLRELDDICDHIGILHEGRLLYQCDMEALKDGIHKVQLVDKSGDVVTKVLKGQVETIRSELEEEGAKVLEFMPLTLEEVFIHEIGGGANELKNILF